MDSAAEQIEPQPETRPDAAIRQVSGAKEQYPTTSYSWIDQRLDEGDNGQRLVWHRLMEFYTLPLTAYVERRFGQADPAPDTVASFFARRMQQPDYLTRWRRSERPLRVWLIGGVCLEYQALRDGRRHWDTVDPDSLPSAHPAAESDFDRSFARRLMGLAVARASEHCVERHLELHWVVFKRHTLHDVSYQTLSEALGIPEETLSGMARTARLWFRDIVRDLLLEGGATVSELPAKIAEWRLLLGE